MYKANMLVFVDETGKDARDSARRFGYALRGQTPQVPRLFIQTTEVCGHQ